MITIDIYNLVIFTCLGYLAFMLTYNHILIRRLLNLRDDSSPMSDMREGILKVIQLKAKLSDINGRLIHVLSEDPFFAEFIYPENMREEKGLFKKEQVLAYIKKDKVEDDSDTGLLTEIVNRAVQEEHISQLHVIHSIIKERDAVIKEGQELERDN